MINLIIVLKCLVIASLNVFSLASIEVNDYTSNEIKDIIGIKDYFPIETNFSDNQFTNTMPKGINSIATFYKANEDSKKLIIFHEGHSITGHIFNNESIKRFNEEGYDVIAFDMILKGGNSKPFDSHYNLSRLYEPINYFIQPVLKVLDVVEYHYTEINMVGFSGGAWTTLITCSIDGRIDSCYEIDGSLPLDRYAGRDFEQEDFDFYNNITYYDLYRTASSDIDASSDREYVQILTDSVVFPRCSYKIRPYEKLIGNGFRVYLDDEKIHKISNNTLNFVLEDMK